MRSFARQTARSMYHHRAPCYSYSIVSSWCICMLEDCKQPDFYGLSRHMKGRLTVQQCRADENSNKEMDDLDNETNCQAC